MKSTYTVEGRHPADDTSPSSILTKWMSFSLVGNKDPESLNMGVESGCRHMISYKTFTYLILCIQLQNSYK